MNPIVRNILAVIAGLLIGSLVNGGIVQVGLMVVPLPEGADVSTPEGLAEALPRFTVMNFMPPLLAHALGTLIGAAIAAKLAAGRGLIPALIVGGFFLMGGIMMVFMVGGPIWFIVVDLGLAYIPMALLGYTLARGKPAEAQAEPDAAG